MFLAINAAFILLINNKGVNMNNLKKVGLSALAGSLVAFSANAVELGVSGTAEVTYTTIGGSTANTGNPFGANNSVKFSGSGDVGVGTATITRTINDSNNGEWLSAWMTLDMGAMGKLSLDSVGGDLEGLGPKDDNLPTAYEEVWTGVSSSGISGAASNDTLGYSNSFGGIGISLAQTRGGTRATGDGGNGGTATTTTSDWVVTLDGSALVDGLSGGVMASTASSSVAGVVDDEVVGGWVNYSSGPISVGYRMSEIQSGTASAAGKNVEAYAIAFNVNDNMSVSVATQDVEYDKAGAAAANVTETIDAINASYTMGAASVRASVSEANDDAGTAGTDDEHMELSLVLSF